MLAVSQNTLSLSVLNRLSSVHWFIAASPSAFQPYFIRDRLLWEEESETPVTGNCRCTCSWCLPGVASHPVLIVVWLGV